MEMPLIRCWTLGCGQLGLSEVQGTVLSTRMGTLVLMAAQGHSGEKQNRKWVWQNFKKCQRCKTN